MTNKQILYTTLGIITVFAIIKIVKERKVIKLREEFGIKKVVPHVTTDRKPIIVDKPND